MRTRYCLAAAALLLVACGQSTTPAQSGAEVTEPVDESAPNAHAPSLPEVAPVLRAAPNSGFTAIEPTEVGIIGAPTVMEALEPLLGPELTEGSHLALSINAHRDEAIADIVRTSLQDDSVSAGHVRVEFRREPDGWYPTNAYRRSQCARGELTGQWTSGVCP